MPIGTNRTKPARRRYVDPTKRRSQPYAGSSVPTPLALPQEVIETLERRSVTARMSRSYYMVTLLRWALAKYPEEEDHRVLDRIAAGVM